MIEITDIKTTKKGRYALFCGDKFLFSVDEVTLYDFRVKIGCCLDEMTFERLKDQSDSRRAIGKGLEFLAIRPHSRGELAEKLMRTYDRDTADYAVEYLESINYINDLDFAELYAEELIALKHKSLSEARSKLFLKKLDREIISQVLEEYSEYEPENALWTLENKMRTDDSRKAYAALARRGFSSSAIRYALSSWNEEIYDD